MDQTRANQAYTSNVDELEHCFPKLLDKNETEHHCFAAITTAPTKTGSTNVTFQIKLANSLLNLRLATNTYLFSIITTQIIYIWNR